MRKVIPILNPAKDMSGAHAFDPNRVAPRPIFDPPWGEHPDDDMFLTVELSDEVYEACALCDTEGCVNCDGLGLVEHDCTGGGDPRLETKKTAGVGLPDSERVWDR